VDALIQVVEELLPNGAQGWEEVAPLYQARSGEMILRDRNDLKQHWVEMCCNKFKKPTHGCGVKGDDGLTMGDDEEEE
jgi:hypothetical protein